MFQHSVTWLKQLLEGHVLTWICCEYLWVLGLPSSPPRQADKEAASSMTQSLVACDPPDKWRAAVCIKWIIPSPTSVSAGRLLYLISIWGRWLSLLEAPHCLQLAIGQFFEASSRYVGFHMSSGVQIYSKAVSHVFCSHLYCWKKLVNETLLFHVKRLTDLRHLL